MRIPWISTSGSGSPTPRATGTGEQAKQRESKKTPPNESKGRIERWSDWSTGVRTLLFNLGLVALAALLLYIGLFRNPSAIVIGNIDSGEMSGSASIKNEDLHSKITEAFRGAYRLGGDAMPKEVVANSIADEASQIDFEIPGIRLSFNKLINYVPKKLGMDRDGTVTGKLTHTEPGGYLFHAELIDHDGPVGFEGSDASLDALLLKAASELLRVRNPYVYASGLSVKERSSCYSDIQNCDFAKATLTYQAIEQDVETKARHAHWNLLDLIRSTQKQERHYREWALLAVSKIREDQRDYAGEVELAKLTTNRWSEFSWGYYNWGVALAELGCFTGAIRAFSRTISLHDTYAAAYNARGRIHLIRAQALSRSEAEDPTNERRKALRDFTTAIALNSDYAEAHINLGKAYRLDPMEYRLARVEFEAVIETPDSPHAARAFQQLAIVERLQGNDARYLDDMGSARRATTNKICGFEFSHSLKEASGCMEQPEKDLLPDLSSSLDCRRHTEGLPLANDDDTL